MKKFIKKIIPKYIVNRYRELKNIKIARKSFRLDYKRFINSAFSIRKNTHLDQLKGRIILHYHSLEKGFTNRKFRYGFGNRAYASLIQDLYEFKKMGFDTNDVSFQTGVSVLQEYINIHKNSDIDTTLIKTAITELNTSLPTNFGGIIVIDKNKIKDDSQRDFYSFSKSRHSVRDFDKVDVSIKTIENALELAKSTPSVCNRQPWKVYVIKNTELLRKTMFIQGGLTAQGDNLNTILLITSNNHFFSNYTERNQGFIDAGMLSMNLIYSLHYYGLATCALNGNLSIENDKKMRNLLNIPESQNIVMFIAVGHYNKLTKVPKSKRDNLDLKTVFYL